MHVGWGYILKVTYVQRNSLPSLPGSLVSILFVDTSMYVHHITATVEVRLSQSDFTTVLILADKIEIRSTLKAGLPGSHLYATSRARMTQS